jgi:hypothetical protein
MNYRNSEGYADPTAGAAVAHIGYEERLKNRLEKKKRRNAAKKKRHGIGNRILPSKQSERHSHAACIKAYPSMNAQGDDNTEVSE